MGRRAGNGTPISFFAFQDIITAVTGILILITLMLALEIVAPAVSRVATVEATARAVTPQQIAMQASSNQQMRERLKALTDAVAVLGQASPTTQAIRTMELSDASAAFRQLLKNRAVELATAEAQAARAASELKAAGEQESDAERQIREAEQTLTKVSKIGNTKLLPGVSTKKPIVIECRAAGITVGSVNQNGETSVLAQATARDAMETVERVRQESDSSTQYFVVYVHADAATLGAEVVKNLRRGSFDVGWDLLGSKQHIFGK